MLGKIYRRNHLRSSKYNITDEKKNFTLSNERE